MIFDIYEQSDLLQIANCRRQSKLERWLGEKRIPYEYDSKGKVIAHKKAVEAGLGVELGTDSRQDEPDLWLGDDYAAKEAS